METPKFTTIQELIDYLKIKKEQIDKLQKKNQELSISLNPIRNISVDLMFEIEAFLNEGETYISSYRKISFNTDTLSLYASGKTFPMAASLVSVKVKKLSEPMPTKEMYEVLPQ